MEEAEFVIPGLAWVLSRDAPFPVSVKYLAHTLQVKERGSILEVPVTALSWNYLAEGSKSKINVN